MTQDCYSGRLGVLWPLRDGPSDEPATKLLVIDIQRMKMDIRTKTNIWPCLEALFKIIITTVASNKKQCRCLSWRVVQHIHTRGYSSAMKRENLLIATITCKRFTLTGEKNSEAEMEKKISRCQRLRKGCNQRKIVKKINSLDTWEDIGIFYVLTILIVMPWYVYIW